MTANPPTTLGATPVPGTRRAVEARGRGDELLSIGALTLIVHPNAVILGHTFRLFDVGGACAIAGLLMTLVFSSIKNTIALYRAEPMPARRDRV